MSSQKTTKAGHGARIAPSQGSAAISVGAASPHLPSDDTHSIAPCMDQLGFYSRVESEDSKACSAGVRQRLPIMAAGLL